MGTSERGVVTDPRTLEERVDARATREVFEATEDVGEAGRLTSRFLFVFGGNEDSAG